MPSLDTSYLEAATLLLPAADKLNLILVGCGGTGSWLAPTVVRMARLLREQRKQVGIDFFDNDCVERKNLFRQNFCDAEVGRNKAVTLAARYGLAWGMDIIAHSERFAAGNSASLRGGVTILIGCVDNAAGRQEMHKAMARNNPYNDDQKYKWWLDCGNAEDSGQVIFGTETDSKRFARNVFEGDGVVCRRLPAPSLVEPQLLIANPEELAAQKLSCAEIQLRNTQSLSVNQQVAAIAGDYLLRIVTGTLTKYATYFDLKSGVMRSKYITRQELRKYRTDSN